MGLEIRRNLTIELEVSHVPFALYGARRRAFLVKQRGESMRHVMMKLAGLILLYHPELEVEASAGQHYKPDLLRYDARGRVASWIDCGTTSLVKLDRLTRSRSAPIVDIIKPSVGALAAYKREADARLLRPERVRYWSLGDFMIERMEGALSGRHAIVATVTAGFSTLELWVDDRETLSAPIERMGHAVDPVGERERERGGA